MMINGTLYKRELKGSCKLLVIFTAIMTLYVSVIITMYDPELMAMLDGFVEAMPEMMAAVGMRAGAASLLGFMISYLYGFVLLVFPMVFSILRGNGLIAKYVDSGAMVYLTASPVKRRTVACTQMSVLLSGILFLIGYATVLEIAVAESCFPGELAYAQLFKLNVGLLGLQLAIGGICFLASCMFSDTRYSVGFGAGIPALMFVLQMLSNAGTQAEAVRYFSIFTLFNPDGIAAGETGAWICVLALFAGAIALDTTAVAVFEKKDLYI